jgi:hypothetical protein
MAAKLLCSVSRALVSVLSVMLLVLLQVDCCEPNVVPLEALKWTLLTQRG